MNIYPSLVDYNSLYIDFPYRAQTQVLLGVNDLGVAGMYEKRISVRRSDMVLHESYNPNTLANNIGLVRLIEDVTGNRYIAPIPIAYDNDEDYDDCEAVITGWNFNNRFYVGEVKVLSSDYCKGYV